MARDRRSLPWAFIIAGLLGVVALGIASRANPPAWGLSDFVRGLWLGGCIGSEILGVALLRRSPRKSATTP